MQSGQYRIFRLSWAAGTKSVVAADDADYARRMTKQTPKKDRQYDVIVWGATGFTGQLVVEYLARNYPNGLTWAVAGRNPDKLASVLEEFAGNATPDRLTADSHDLESLNKLAASTKVVLTTVGPYALYGNELVQACVDNGTDYCDLAGEVQWMRRIIDSRGQSATPTVQFQYRSTLVAPCIPGYCPI